MKHPIIKLFLARLRAISAAERAAYPVPELWPFLEPFSRHLIRFEERAGGGFVVIGAGDSVARLFSRPIVGSALSELFGEGDEHRVTSMLTSALSDGVGWVFGGEIRTSRFRAITIEAAFAPEPRQPDAPRRGAACILPFNLSNRRARIVAPRLWLSSQRSFDLDQLSGAHSRRQRPHSGLRRG
ncbi:hypothetical protein [Terrarubrum flagellatum]|uniref:hypothetical protein n=1 Tax=Terrirubrum flagellatum TaxID=2895980 RepID=UPI0031453CD3